MKIKDIKGDLRGLKFYLPTTGDAVYWWSSWGYPDGEAGIWYKEDMDSSQIYPFFERSTGI